MRSRETMDLPRITDESVVWEVEAFEWATGKLPPPWEPFAVADGFIWAKRRTLAERPTHEKP